MPKKIYDVELSASERDHLENIVSSGTEKARKLTRARILLKADEGWTDPQIQAALDVSRPTVERVRRKYVTEGLNAALNRKKPDREYEHKIDGRDEAHLIALVCGDPPEGYAKWSMRLLTERFVALEQVEVETVSHETVRQVLKKMNLSPGKTNNG
jgi:transposase